MRFAGAPALEHDLVADPEIGMRGGDYGAGEVDAWNKWETPHDRRRAGDRQSVLVVDRGVFDRNGDVAFHQVGLGKLGDGDRLLLVGVAGDQDRLEI